MNSELRDRRQNAGKAFRDFCSLTSPHINKCVVRYVQNQALIYKDIFSRMVRAFLYFHRDPTDLRASNCQSQARYTNRVNLYVVLNSNWSAAMRLQWDLFMHYRNFRTMFWRWWRVHSACSRRSTSEFLLRESISQLQRWIQDVSSVSSVQRLFTISIGKRGEYASARPGLTIRTLTCTG